MMGRGGTWKGVGNLEGCGNLEGSGHVLELITL